MLGQADAALAAAERWVSLGRDVLVRGGDGAGKSAFLDALHDRWSRRGLSCLVLRGAYATTLGPLAPVQVQDAAAAAARSGRPVTATGAELVAALAEELAGQGGLVLLDDLDLVDAATVGVLERVLGRTSAPVVATTTADPTTLPDPLREFVAQRAPADVRLEPLGHRATSDLLLDRLGAPAEAPVIAAVATRSGGNPRTAVALVDAARFAGVLTRDGERWTASGSFDDVPLSPVVNGLCARLDREDVDALELLAWTGPMPLRDAERLVGRSALSRLVDRGRAATIRAEADLIASVSPPALAHGLRRGLTEPRRLALAERVAGVFGADFVPAYAAGRALDPAREADLAPERAEGAHAHLAQLVADHAAIQEAVRRSAWRRETTAANAVLLLRSVKRRLRPEQIEEIFEQTPLTPEDRPAAVAELQIHRAVWTWAHGGSPQSVESILAEPDASGARRPLAALVCSLLLDDLHAVRREVDLAWSEHEGDRDPFIERLLVLLTAQTLVEEARFEEALALADGILDTGPTAGPEVDLGASLEDDLGANLDRVERGTTLPYLQGVRTHALLGSGRIDDAVAWARSCLGLARDDLDAVGIRIHAVGLAEALYFAGEHAEAWRAVSTALGLEPSGPFDGGYHRRLFALASILQTLVGDLSLGWVLHQEAVATERSVHTPFDAEVEIAGAAYAGAAGDVEAAGAALWETGQRLAGRGLRASAALCWAMRGQPYTAAELAHIRTALPPIPLVEPYLRLHEAIVGGDETSIREALAGCRPACAPTLALSALTAIDAAREEAGRSTLTGEEREALVGAALRTRLTATGEQVGAELSDRERQVALLAREGLSNRQIAERLYLSVRTVENHMYRALRKLGLSGRADLSSWLP